MLTYCLPLMRDLTPPQSASHLPKAPHRILTFYALLQGHNTQTDVCSQHVEPALNSYNQHSTHRTSTQHVEPALNTWNQHSTGRTSTQRTEPALKTWSQRSVPKTSTQYLKPTLNTWNQLSIPKTSTQHVEPPQNRWNKHSTSGTSTQPGETVLSAWNQYSIDWASLQRTELALKTWHQHSIERTSISSQPCTRLAHEIRTQHVELSLKIRGIHETVYACSRLMSLQSARLQVLKQKCHYKMHVCSSFL